MDYFPKGLFPPDRCNPENLSIYLGVVLRGMGEQPMALATASQCYRVLALPSWSLNRVIRIEAAGDRWLVTGKRDLLPPGPESAERLECAERETTIMESAEVEAALNRLRLWELPVMVERFGCDGTTWFLEGWELGRYHAVWRWSPEEPEIVEWCHLLHRLSGMGRE